MKRKKAFLDNFAQVIEKGLGGFYKSLNELTQLPEVQLKNLANYSPS